jgi:hypothetical protein
MTWPKWVLLGWLLLSLTVNWYIVDRPRDALTPPAAFLSTLILIFLAVMVVIA